MEIDCTDAGGELRHYVYSVENNPERRRIALGYGMMYNSSRKPNLETYHDPRGFMGYYAKRDIAAQEELFIDYGDAWWVQRQALGLHKSALGE